MAIPDEIRRMLVSRCSSRRTRDATFTRAEPCDWCPREIKDPRPAYAGAYFTDDSAWEFIAEQYSMSHEIHEVTLDRPPGKKAWALVAAGLDGVKIYIKLQLKTETVRARSFHVSTTPSKP